MRPNLNQAGGQAFVVPKHLIAMGYRQPLSHACHLNFAGGAGAGGAEETRLHGRHHIGWWGVSKGRAIDNV